MIKMLYQLRGMAVLQNFKVKKLVRSLLRKAEQQMHGLILKRYGVMSIK